MLPFGVTIPATVPQGSEIPEGLMNNPVHALSKTALIKKRVLSQPCSIAHKLWSVVCVCVCVLELRQKDETEKYQGKGRESEKSILIKSKTKIYHVKKTRNIAEKQISPCPCHEGI
jgi:hypothetical protein